METVRGGRRVPGLHPSLQLDQALVAACCRTLKMSVAASLPVSVCMM
jgi:hypothetical protein